MPPCSRCGAHVAVQFARVFGDNEDVVHACLGCSRTAELAALSGGDPTRRAPAWDDASTG